ncbi:hypothetical protein [Streptomyces sp. NPDC053755]|uniref:hypothetical protein n=1 Tax=Streptomyces sp. NPDC053755 TaxID=3155815 RepID=UPI0034220C2D
MRNLIARALGGALIPVMLWLLMRTLPPTGRHREAPPRARHAASPRPSRPPRVATRRSPYSREQAAPLDGARSPLVRPYVAAAAGRAAQRKRRRVLWLATVGLDVDHRNIHAGAR